MYPEAIRTLLFRGIIIVWSIGTVFLGNVWEKRPLPIIISIFKKFRQENCIYYII